MNQQYTTISILALLVIAGGYVILMNTDFFGFAIAGVYNCTDTDGGMINITRGETFVTKPDGAEWGRLPDRCFRTGDGNYSDSGDRLQELYCKKKQNTNRNGMIAFKTIPCNCAMGACAVETSFTQE